MGFTYEQLSGSFQDIVLAEERKNIRCTILAYLGVLMNHMPDCSGMSFSLTEYQVGKDHICGCLHRLMDYAEYTDNEEMQALIKERERINGRWDYDQNNPKHRKELAEVSEKCARYLYSYLRDGAKSTQQEKFLQELDAKFKEILRM